MNSLLFPKSLFISGYSENLSLRLLVEQRKLKQQDRERIETDAVTPLVKDSALSTVSSSSIQ